MKQLSLEETNDRGCKWDINNAHAQKIHRTLVEMIALNSQPF